VVLSLTQEEKAAVTDFLETLLKTEDAAWMAEPIGELKELIKGGPKPESFVTRNRHTNPVEQAHGKPESSPELK
jgi:hypothetical protein